jgi:hypothetical protein
MESAWGGPHDAPRFGERYAGDGRRPYKALVIRHIAATGATIDTRARAR